MILSVWRIESIFRSEIVCLVCRIIQTHWNYIRSSQTAMTAQPTKDEKKWNEGNWAQARSSKTFQCFGFHLRSEQRQMTKTNQCSFNINTWENDLPFIYLLLDEWLLCNGHPKNDKTFLFFCYLSINGFVSCACVCCKYKRQKVYKWTKTSSKQLMKHCRCLICISNLVSFTPNYTKCWSTLFVLFSMFFFCFSFLSLFFKWIHIYMYTHIVHHRTFCQLNHESRS